MWAEWYRWLAEAGLPPQHGLPRDAWQWEISLPDVADLSDDTRLARVGLPLLEPTRLQWATFQPVGEQLHADGWPALLAASAARPAGRVLCVFRTMRVASGRTSWRPLRSVRLMSWAVETRPLDWRAAPAAVSPPRRSQASRAIVRLMQRDEPTLALPADLVDAIATRTAEIVVERIRDDLRPATQLWLRTRQAAEYLGLSRTALYRRRHQIPHYRSERLLLFRRDELDAWVERHRFEPAPAAAPQPRLGMSTAAARQAADAIRAAGGRRDPGRGRGARTRRLTIVKTQPSQERALPAPLGFSDERKDHSAWQLEITREQLNQMSPRQYQRAWDRRNQRLRDARVFDYLGELQARFGQQGIDERTPSELIAAVEEIRATEVDLGS